MNLRSRTTRFVVALAATLSLVAGVVTVPATSASASSAGVSAAASISAKKKVLTTEQKNAKKALDAAVKDLAKKEKLLATAIKDQAKTAKALAKASKAAETAQVRKVKGASKKDKARARAAAKKLATAKAKDDRAIALVARRTVMRDTAQAKVIRLDAKYAWLMKDLSTLQCGVGESVTTASGAVEVVRECGIVYMHEDGDTTHVKTTTNKMIEIRNIGLQTPERKKGSNVAQCGADAAYENFKALMPEEITIVQLRSVADSTNGWGGGARPLRSVYKLNNATGQFDIDVQAEQIKAGWSLWWPLAAEWAHNKEYLDLMNDAKARGVGIWNPNLCGASPGGVPLMWFSQNAPTIDADTEPAFGEYVILKNETSSLMDLTGWMLRDNSLNFFWDAATGAWMQGLNKFGSMLLGPGEHRIIYLDNPDGYPLSATEYEYFNWSRNTPGAQLTNGSIGGLKGPNYINGDGLYLQDSNGNIRASMTNPCTSSAMCETPAWVAEILSETRAGQIIPIPVALNKVANATRDRYNPVVSIDSTKTFDQNKALLEAKGFRVQEGTAIVSPVATTHAAQITVSVANIQTTLGRDKAAGWGVIVVYQDAMTSPHHIRILKGMAQESIIEDDLFGFDGFQTANAGNVLSEVALVSFDGDASNATDSIAVIDPGGSAVIADRANPDNNIANSTISLAGINTPYLNNSSIDRSSNTFGVDVDRISLVNGLSRNVTSAELQPSVSSDVFYLTGIALSNEITSPNIQLTKYASAVSGGDANTVETGDTVQYTITATNNGQANASNLIIRDDLGADLTLAASTATDCASVPAGDVCKNLGALNAGATASFTITGTVTGASQSTTGEFDNFASATFDGPLGSQTAQSQIVTLSYGPVGIDLASQVGFTTDFIQAGQSTTITASVTNLGPSSDPNPSVELVAQDGAQMTVANVLAGCAITATTTMLCNATALGISAANPLVPGATASVTFTVTPKRTATSFKVWATAKTGHSTADSNASNDTAETMLYINHKPKAKIAKAKAKSGGTPIQIQLATKISDVDGDSLRITFGKVKHGSAEVNGDVITYTPPKKWTGTLKIRYTVNDGKGGTAKSWIVVKVTKSASSGGSGGVKYCLRSGC